MNRLVLAAIGLTCCLSLTSPAHAQMGMDLFKKPSITKVFNPVVGMGAEYMTTSDRGGDEKGRTTQLFIVGKETFEGQDAFWMEFVGTDDKGKATVGKALLTKENFEFHRMVFQAPGMPAMEMPMNTNEARRGKIEEKLNDWHSVGTESITVPAGTFSCEHWRDDKNNSDVWTSDKVTPFGMVKQVSPHSTMLLVKMLSDMQDKITGPVQKFDPQQMMQQMQQQHQQQKP